MNANELIPNRRRVTASDGDCLGRSRTFTESSRLLLGSSLLVFEHARDSLRLACVSRTGEAEVHIRWSQSIEAPSVDSAIATMSLCASLDQRPQCAVVVSSEVSPAVYCETGPRAIDGGLFGLARRTLGPESAMSGVESTSNDMAIGWVAEETARDPIIRRCVVSRVPRATRQRWLHCLRALGIDLAGLYPLAGCPIAAMDRAATRTPTLCLQIETDLTAVVETDQGGCRAIEVFHQRPSLGQCVELVGTGCPEVLLFGGGEQLRPLALELALTGVTWVRILEPAGVEEHAGSGSENLGSIIGAARHAFGIAPPDAMACVPAVD